MSAEQDELGKIPDDDGSRSAQVGGIIIVAAFLGLVLIGVAFSAFWWNG